MKKAHLRVVPLLFVIFGMLLSAVPDAFAGMKEVQPFYPDSGNYTGMQTVAWATTQDCVYYYTTDGSDPRNSASRRIGTEVVLDSSAKLRVVSYWVSPLFEYFGPVGTSRFNIKRIPAPKLETCPGEVPSLTITNIPRDWEGYSSQEVLASADEWGFTSSSYSWDAYYTEDGTDPTASSSALQCDSSSIPLNSSGTIKVAFRKSLYRYELMAPGNWDTNDASYVWGRVTNYTID